MKWTYDWLDAEDRMVLLTWGVRAVVAGSGLLGGAAIAGLAVRVFRVVAG